MSLKLFNKNIFFKEENVIVAIRMENMAKSIIKTVLLHVQVIETLTVADFSETQST